MNSAINIGVYVQTWHVGGVAAFCERIAEGLQRLGCNTRLILSTPFGKRDLAGRHAYEKLLERKLCLVHCLHLNAYHPNERPWRAAGQIAALECDALLLSSHHTICPSLADLAPRTALVGIAHNDDDDRYAEFQASHEYCAAYVGVSAAIADSLKQLSKKPGLPVHHIPCGVPINSAPGAVPTTLEPRILTVCRLEQRQKRVLDLPLVWRQYRERGGTGHLTICGPGEEEARLREAFASDIQAGRVVMTGAVELQQMPAVYAGHDIVLSVSAYEGLPIGVLEATTAGLLPVLSETRSGHREIIEAVGAGRLCPIGDTEAFAYALLEISSDLPRLRAGRQPIRDKARARFSLEVMVQSYAQLLSTLVSARQAQPHSPPPPILRRPKVDFLRSFVRRWQYSRHYDWRG